MVFEAGRVVLTPGGRQGRDDTARFTYQLTTVRAGSSMLPLGASLDAPVISVTGNTLAYARGSDVVEWYTSRRTVRSKASPSPRRPPLDGDLVIVGAFATRLGPELVSQREGILFRNPASGQSVLRYGGVLVTDSAGRRTAGELDLRGNQIARYNSHIQPSMHNSLIR